MSSETGKISKRQKQQKVALEATDVLNSVHEVAELYLNALLSISGDKVSIVASKDPKRVVIRLKRPNGNVIVGSGDSLGSAAQAMQV
jgi:hypothetical protein